MWSKQVKLQIDISEKNTISYWTRTLIFREKLLQSDFLLKTNKYYWNEYYWREFKRTFNDLHKISYPNQYDAGLVTYR